MIRSTLSILALLLPVACVGRVASEPSCPPPDACDRLLPRTRGAVQCPGGAVGYVCCGYTEAELEQLRAEGDFYALRCADPSSTNNE